MYLSKSVYFASFPALSPSDSLLSLSSVLPSSTGVPPETNGQGGERARKGRRQKRVEEPEDNASGSDWPAREISADPRNKEGPGNIEQSGEGREGGESRRSTKGGGNEMKTTGIDSDDSANRTRETVNPRTAEAKQTDVSESKEQKMKRGTKRYSNKANKNDRREKEREGK